MGGYQCDFLGRKISREIFFKESNNFIKIIFTEGMIVDNLCMIAGFLLISFPTSFELLLLGKFRHHEI